MSSWWAHCDGGVLESSVDPDAGDERRGLLEEGYVLMEDPEVVASREGEGVRYIRNVRGNDRGTFDVVFVPARVVWDGGWIWEDAGRPFTLEELAEKIQEIRNA